MSQDNIFLYLTIDESGSMSDIKSAVLEGINNFINEQKEDAIKFNRLNTTYLCIRSFNNKAKVIYDGNLENAIFNDELYKPNNSTRLYDTVCEDIDFLLKKTENIPKEVNKSVYCLITDGNNNSGFKNLSDMNESIAKAKDNNITCIFLGSNQDAIKEGVKYGFKKETSLTFDANPDNTRAAMRTLSNGISRAVSCEGMMEFSQVEREESVEGYYSSEDEGQYYLHRPQRQNACEAYE